MAPSATTNGTANGSPLNATAKSFQTTESRFHAASSDEAFHAEHEYAAHNYHPLPVVFSRASGVDVWDPEGRQVEHLGPSPALRLTATGTISTSCRHTAP